jgi:hypothetical protein
MKYMLLLNTAESTYARMNEAQMRDLFAAYTSYTEALRNANVYVDSNRLRPVATATTVRVANGKTQVLNGPYAEAKEQLGGYFMIDAPDLDAALAWAARCPSASHGAVEVRPIWQM